MCGDTEPPHKKIVQHFLCCWPAVQHLCGQVFAPDMQWCTVTYVCTYIYNYTTQYPRAAGIQFSIFVVSCLPQVCV